MNTFSLAPLFRSSIGFDRFNDLFETAMSADAVAYPPYNVVKKGDDEYRIEIAAAGMTEQELEISVEKDVLTIASARREAQNETQYLHRGIAQRAFKLSFRLADYIEVQNAVLSNGLLSVELVRRIPESAKPRRIAVNGSNVTPIAKAA
ncbi:molecular chaperone IbpA [Panacagrimonas perspica]|uniref:Molecular chaperone IbpA n=1 Tax=Panacagrimonas perspica TaxID=381431 RepID=A0A4S3K6Q5_9GAMM|nr:Hsp20 family protein [Panacagrimonas perspica]TDU25537.1 molecular chaperone IbpA [Panacagrimonas perspica]THD03857.1 heat-shock protein [Panacagrimonas perspica]